MAPSAVVQRNKHILELLSDKSSMKRVILVGDSGVGKTWTARQISNRAVKKGLFEIAFWVFVDRKFNNQAVCESIARQLSLLSIADEWEPEDGNNEAEKKDEENKVLSKMIADFLKGKRFLLILDYGRNEMEEENIMSNLESLLDLPNQSSYKVLITSAKSVSSNDADEEVIAAPRGDEKVTAAPTGDETVVPVKPLPEDESLSFLQERVGRKVDDDSPIKALAKAFIKKTKYLPAAIILMAKAISYCSKRDSGLRMLQSALEEAPDNECYNIIQLLRSGYDALPRSIVIDCCRRGSHFFRDRGSIHYNELIAYWIMEGYLGHANCLEKAYEEGHSVFMELVDCQVLKKLEGGYVIMDKAILNFDDCDRYGFGGTARLGLADLFADGGWEGFGRITQTNGKIKSLSTGKKEQKLSTLFLRGDHCAEMLDDSASWKNEIEVLALFNPTLKSLPGLLSVMSKLFVLVLRGCVFLEKINKFEFQKLTVLEISNASSLKDIPNDFFDNMLQLQSLHISELKADFLPSSLEKLRELRWLILRECSSFKTLNSLRNFKNLMVLDVSGATSLEKLKDKAFKETPKLQTLNLSRTSIKSIPKFLNLGELTHISLSGCNSLDRLPKTDALASLQTLDLSGAKSFKEFHEQSLGNPGGLKILDLSGTPLGSLPSKINPRRLFLKNCTELRKLPCIEALEDLEVLDLSGTKSLVEIENDFFSHPKSLQILNLSETRITTLPSLANNRNVRQLLLSGCNALTVIEDESFEHMSSLQHLDVSETMIKFLPRLSNPSSLSVLSLKKCTHLTTLPPLEYLSNLEELNLCGVSALKENGAGFLEHMSHLRILDLSETPLAQLPSLSKLKSLTQLFLRGCKSLQEVPNLEELTRLEVLDLSGTGVTHLPSLDNFSNLRQLLLGGCSSLERFRQVDSLDQLPCGISNLTNLECLDLPNTKNTQGGESGNTNSLPEVVDPCRWGIASLPDGTSVDSEKPPISLSGNQFLQSLNSKQFHLCVHPTFVQSKTGDTFSYRNDLIFRDLRFQTAEFVHFKEQRSLEIHGFSHFPTGIEDVLCNADSVFFINNTFTKWFSNIDVSSLKAIKGCWIERCTEMEGAFHEGQEDDISKLGKILEVLGISNAISLNSIHGGNLSSRVFQNLQSLYLDCCPKLPTVFSASQLPENLKVLQVKFCDNLERVFEQSLLEPVLQKLETLYLWELPKLESIGCRLPSLLTLKVWECPKLEKLEDSIRSAEGLQTLWIYNVVNLKSIYSGSQQPESLRNLETLVLESCPMLENVLSSPQAPPSLKTLKIRSCNEVKAVFNHDSSSDYILKKLQTLHLYKLPKLENIGGKRPHVQNPVIMGCPNCRDSTAA